MERLRWQFSETCLGRRGCSDGVIQLWSSSQTLVSLPSLRLNKLRTRTWLTWRFGTAQFFPVADHVIILESGGIKVQGNWTSIQHYASSSISKFSLQHQTDRVVRHIQPSASARLSTQIQAAQQAQADLARKTGDLRLYCQSLWAVNLVERRVALTRRLSGYYFRFVGLFNLALLAGCTASYSLFITLPQHWLKLWTKSSMHSQAFYVYGFLLLSLVSWASTSGTMW